MLNLKDQKAYTPTRTDMYIVGRANNSFIECCYVSKCFTYINLFHFYNTRKQVQVLSPFY